MDAADIKTIATAAAVCVVGVLAFKAVNAGAAVAAKVGDVLATDLNPASSDNIINRGVSAIGEAVTGQQGWSLGSAIYDATHPAPETPGFVDRYLNWAGDFWGFGSTPSGAPVASYDETDRLAKRYPTPVAPVPADGGINWPNIWGF